MLFGKKKDVKPEVFTEETCKACDEKTRRQFKDGDYVFNFGENCPKCSGTTMITAIYGEYPPGSKID